MEWANKEGLLFVSVGFTGPIAGHEHLQILVALEGPHTNTLCAKG